MIVGWQYPKIQKKAHGLYKYGWRTGRIRKSIKRSVDLRVKKKNDYLRHLILCGYTYFVNYSELHDYNVNLSRISKSLNQIAAKINATGNIYQDDMEEVKELMKQVMNALSKASSVGDKQAFHLIQSFASGEVDFDTAHQVGIELVDKQLTVFRD